MTGLMAFDELNVKRMWRGEEIYQHNIASSATEERTKDADISVGAIKGRTPSGDTLDVFVTAKDHRQLDHAC